MSVTEFQRSSERWDSTSNGPDRLDLVAEELDADRVGRVGGEDVEDAAADAELAGHLDDLGPRHAALEQPGRQVFDGHRRRRRRRCATSGPGPRAWAPAEASPETARRPAGAGWRSTSFLSTRIRRPKTSSAAFSSRGSFSQAGKTSGTIPANVATSSRKSSTSPTWASRITSVVGACSPSAADDQGRRRAPGAVDRRAAAVLERRHDLGKPRRALDLPRQVLELPDGGALRGSTRTLGHGSPVACQWLSWSQ